MNKEFYKLLNEIPDEPIDADDQKIIDKFIKLEPAITSGISNQEKLSFVFDDKQEAFDLGKASSKIYAKKLAECFLQRVIEFARIGYTKDEK